MLCGFVYYVPNKNVVWVVGCGLSCQSVTVSQSLSQQRWIGSGSIATNASASLVTCVVQER